MSYEYHDCLHYRLLFPAPILDPEEIRVSVLSQTLHEAQVDIVINIVQKKGRESIWIQLLDLKHSKQEKKIAK